MSQKSEMKLSIVIPLFNEEMNIETVWREVSSVCISLERSYEIIFVDDGSRDRTWEVVEELKKTTPQLKAIKFKRNYGQTSAMVAGFDYASGAAILLIILITVSLFDIFSSLLRKVVIDGEEQNSFVAYLGFLVLLIVGIEIIL